MQAFQKGGFLEDKVLSVVGGTGGMGKLFAKIFKNCVKEVAICSRTFEKAKRIADSLGISAWPIEESAEADIVLVSVPVEETYEVCRAIVGKMSENSLLMELSSVKQGISDRLSKNFEEKKIEYLSLHPLFGPRIRSIKGRRIVIIPLKTGPIAEKVIEFLRGKDALIIESNVEEHDRYMAIIQVAHHFAFLSLLTMEEFFTKASLREFKTESFKRTDKTLKMIRENLDTILAIQEINPYADYARRKFLESARMISKMDDDSIKKIREAINKYGI